MRRRDRASQALVFAKNSFQARLVGPDRPRALYFGDEVYVGYIPGGRLIELIAVDPKRGLQFYTFDNAAATPPPAFVPQSAECRLCHGSGARAALLASSVIATRDGRPVLATREFAPVAVDHRTPLTLR